MMTPPVRIAKRSCRTLPLLPLIPSVARSPRARTRLRAGRRRIRSPRSPMVHFRCRNPWGDPPMAPRRRGPKTLRPAVVSEEFPPPPTCVLRKSGKSDFVSQQEITVLAKNEYPQKKRTAREKVSGKYHGSSEEENGVGAASPGIGNEEMRYASVQMSFLRTRPSSGRHQNRDLRSRMVHSTYRNPWGDPRTPPRRPGLQKCDNAGGFVNVRGTPHQFSWTCGRLTLIILGGAEHEE